MFGKKKAKGKFALLVNNGSQWFLLDEGVSRSCEDGMPDILPDKILEECRVRKIKRAEILIPADLTLLDLELVEELESEEKHTVIAWELSSVTGCDPENSRIAFADAGLFGFGGGRNLKVCAVFSNSALSGFKDQLNACGVSFEGLGSVQMALAAAHSKSGSEHSGHLLFMRESSSFAFISGTEGGVPSCRNIPVGFSGAAVDGGEWGERLRKRLGPLIGGNVHLILNRRIENIAGKLKEELRCEKAEFEYLHGYLKELFDAAAGEDSFFAHERPKEKDPRRAGTIIAFTIVLLTASLLLFQGTWNTFTKNSLKEKIKLKKELDSERKRQNGQLDSVKRNISRTIKTFRLLDAHKSIDDDFMFIVESIGGITPRYTRLNEIRQEKDGSIAISGISYTQRDIAKFARDLAGLSSKRSLTVEPEDIQSKSGQLEKEFSFKIRKK